MKNIDNLLINYIASQSSYVIFKPSVYTHDPHENNILDKKKNEKIGALATEGYIFYPASWSKGHPRQPVYYFQTCWGFLSESLFPLTNFTIESKPNEGEKCYFLFPRISFPYHVTHHSSSICMKEGDALVLLLNNRPGFLFFF